MLNAIEMDALTRLLAARRGQLTLTKDEQNEAWGVVERAIQAAVAHRAAQARAAHARPPESRGGGAGRLPEVEYTVSLRGQWDEDVMGARAAHQLVLQTLFELDGGLVQGPSLGSMQVQLSRKGTWSRDIETSNGKEMLSVQRKGGPANRTPDYATIPNPDPRKLGSIRVKVGSAEHKKWMARRGKS